MPLQYTYIGNESSVDENSNQFLLYFKIDAWVDALEK